MINDFSLTEYCNSIADDIFADAPTFDDAMDWATESADGSKYVIYYAKAHDLCRNCDTTHGEEFVAECFSDTPMSYDDMACRIAYGEIYNRIQARLWAMNEEQAA
jgi:hypothetical protein